MGVLVVSNIEFLVVQDGDYYSALCLEYTTAGSGPTIADAVCDCIAATIEYLKNNTAEEAPRPATDELLQEYLDNTDSGVRIYMQIRLSSKEEELP